MNKSIVVKLAAAAVVVALAGCFPEGLERERRRQAAESRSKRYMELFQALKQNPKAVPASAIDEFDTSA